MHDYLKKILIQKEHEVEQLLSEISHNSLHPIKEIMAGESNCKVKRSFKEALLQSRLAVIAEIKRRSPSKNKLAEIVDPVALAKEYIFGGAAAISVLTESSGFGGSLTDLIQVSGYLNQINSNVALLRKDFIVNEIQIAESILAGADAILLIVAVLGEQTASFLAAAKRMGIDCLVEVHTLAELEYAIKIEAEIIGINNRNLTTFEVDLNCSRDLIKKMPDSIIKIAESGITTPQLGAELASLGFNALLIGESLVKSMSPAFFIKQLQQLTV